MNDDRLNKIALSRGVAAAERSALKTDRCPLKVTAEGFLGVDFKHLLVKGTRTFAGIADGAVFYDPIMDELAAVSPEGDSAWINTGPLSAKDVMRPLKGRWDKVLLGAIGYASSAHGEDLHVISRWLARRVAEGVMVCLDQGVPAGQTMRVERDPDTIWSALGSAWITQPWGIPLPPEAMGTLV